MKVLLTGHRGYIGAVLTPMLLDRGHAVTGLDSDIFRTCTFVGELAETPEIEKDIRDIVIDDVAGFDAIIHLAGLSNDPLGDYRPNLTEEINFEASLRLAQLAALDVDAGDACFEGTAFGGTCAPFRPRFPGQPCPAPLTDYDSEEWDQDNGTTDPALEQKT